MSEWTSDSFDPHRVCVGIIGLGDMGALYMRKISSQGLRFVHLSNCTPKGRWVQMSRMFVQVVYMPLIFLAAKGCCM